MSGIVRSAWAACVGWGAYEGDRWLHEGSRADRLDRPDRLVMGLDPGEGVERASIVDAAFELREALEGVGLTSVLRTTQEWRVALRMASTRT